MRGEKKSERNTMRGEKTKENKEKKEKRNHF